MKISPKTFLLVAPLLMFFAGSIIWLLILAQTIGFITAFIILDFIFFLIFWRGLLISRRTGELRGLKSRKQIFIFSLGVTLGFGELTWAVSFLPFSFFILGGLLAITFAIIFNIFKEYFKERPDFKKFLVRDIILGIILIAILIFISPWLPPKTF